MSSADTDELAALCHRILIFQRGRLVASLSGPQVTQGSVAQACVAQARIAEDAQERQ